MNRFPGCSHVPNPTGQQLGELADGLMSGRLSKFFVHEGAAYYRRAHGSGFELSGTVSPAGKVVTEDRPIAPVPDYSDEDIERQREQIEREITVQEKVDAESHALDDEPTVAELVRGGRASTLMPGVPTPSVTWRLSSVGFRHVLVIGYGVGIIVYLVTR